MRLELQSTRVDCTSRLVSEIRGWEWSMCSLKLGLTRVDTQIPKSIPSGEYLIRAEHIALHKAGHPQVLQLNGGFTRPQLIVGVVVLYFVWADSSHWRWFGESNSKSRISWSV